MKKMLFFGSSKSIRILPGDINKLILKKATPAPEIKIKLLGRKLHLTNQTNLGPGEQLKMELFDIMGCRVEKFIVRTGSPKQFNLDNLSSGLYFCVVNYKGSVVRMNLNLIR